MASGQAGHACLPAHSSYTSYSSYSSYPLAPTAVARDHDVELPAVVGQHIVIDPQPEDARGRHRHARVVADGERLAVADAADQRAREVLAQRRRARVTLALR